MEKKVFTTSVELIFFPDVIGYLVIVMISATSEAWKLFFFSEHFLLGVKTLFFVVGTYPFQYFKRKYQSLRSNFEGTSAERKVLTQRMSNCSLSLVESIIYRQRRKYKGGAHELMCN